MLVECTDVALDNLDKPLGDWKALKRRMLNKGAALLLSVEAHLPPAPPKVRNTIKWVRNNLLHSGAVGSGGFRPSPRRRRPLLRRAHRGATRHLRRGTRGWDARGGRELSNLAAATRGAQVRDSVDVKAVALEYEDDDFSDRRAPRRIA